jgi:hypothetical protein
MRHVHFVYPLTQKHPPWILDIILDLNMSASSTKSQTYLYEESCGLATVNQTMIICKSDVHHLVGLASTNCTTTYRSDFYLAINGNSTVKDCVQSQDSSLRWIDNGGRHQRSKHTALRN